VANLQQVKRSTGDPVDVVIAWVDGSDPKHRAKRKRYLADPGGNAKPERVATDERRFSDNDEIRFCLRSVYNYAPWVRMIWLVTDDQVPAAIDRRRAERANIRIVDHREIFRGYEQLLPTFNSLAIETMLWRIEGLADRFLYFNDDTMLVGPVEPTHFFSDDGKVNLRGRWTNWKEQLEKGSRFHGSNKLLGAEMLGYTPEHYFSTAHRSIRCCDRRWRSCSRSSSRPSLPMLGTASAIESSFGRSRPTITCCSSRTGHG
jgi:hypothetical protein